MNDIYLILDNIRSILNVGAIFRTADAAGVKKVYLCGITAYPSKKDIKLYDKIVVEEPILIINEDELPKIKYTPSQECIRNSLEKRMKKTALMALGNVQWEYVAKTSDAIDQLKSTGVTVICLEQAEKSVDYRSVEHKRPTALVVGHERLGVSKEALEKSDHIIYLPMHGKGRSLNVATATGIALYKIIESDN